MRGGSATCRAGLESLAAAGEPDARTWRFGVIDTGALARLSLAERGSPALLLYPYDF